MFRFLESLIRGTRAHAAVNPPSGLLSFYWHFIRQTPLPYVAMVLTSLGVALADMTIPVFVGQLVALMEAPDRIAALTAHTFTLSVMVLVVLIVRPLLQFADVAIRHNALMPGATSLVRWQSHWHVVRHSWPFFQQDFAGRIANRVMQTANALRDSVMSSIRAVLYLVTYGALTLVLVSAFDWRLTVPVLIWLLAYVVFLRFFVPRLRHLARQSSDMRSMVMARVVDSYTNILTVKLFSKMADEDTYVREVLDEHQQAMSDHMRMTSLFLFTLYALNALLLLSTTVIGLNLWAQGLIGASQVATALPLVGQITNLSGWVSFEIAAIFENIGVVQEGMQTISVPHSLIDEKNAQPLNVTRGEIRFEQVSFSYGPHAKPIIDGINLIVRPGEHIGLVGRSGAGKSTLVNLLLRFYDIEHGRISVDGQDIRHVTQESLRAQIGLVTQDTSLLHRSIADNIRYGRPQATQAEIEAAARKAQAHEFILGLRDWNGRTGYEAHVGERGVKLSGGQRQRIAIARVILKDAPILLLDEATSALDSEIEASIQEQLIDLMGGKTVIAIAHRLSTIARLDRLIVIDQGKIVEQGAHSELLQRNGLYAALWQHQSGGFLAEEIPEPAEPLSA
ncbi:MAG: ABC transporter ATP-binding protein [Nitrosomonadales bacterium]|nr:ABC transporter ATP-binding protein [Nitrosomonadales bacterium]